ncbi:MAG TPA: Rid family hydrolase [Burkholderiaceae bacterium]|jgi:enamine deaminase RidA (YjgF/YER057c/UK114 family)|nr:Rid family hydrolase [Burkholderiaceae bacterium]
MKKQLGQSIASVFASVRTSVITSAITLIALAGCAVAPPATTVIIPAGQQAAYVKYHYAPAIRVGDTVILSGIPAWKGDTYDQKIRFMFERAKSTLEAAGSSMDDVVEITTFHQNAKDTASFNKEFAEFVKIQGEYFKAKYPAWTAVGVTALLAEDAPVEMRLVAVVGSGKNVSIK